MNGEPKKMNAQTLLNEAMPRLSREHLMNYVTRYEIAPHMIQQMCGRCAVGTMLGASIDDKDDSPFYAWAHDRDEECGRDWHGILHGGVRPRDPLDTVEALFEEGEGIGCDDPRRAIYEAAVAELARRDSLTTAPAPSQSVEVSQ